MAQQVLDGVVPEERREQDRTGGRCANRSAVACETPWAWSPPRSVSGSVAARPRILSVKKIPIESTWAEFWNVWFIPPPAPRSAAGRLFITPARLGDANMPIEIPVSARMSANSGYRKSVGRSIRSPKLTAAATMPAVANGRAPKRSER
jgi:hypothetical protein